MIEKYGIRALGIVIIAVVSLPPSVEQNLQRRRYFLLHELQILVEPKFFTVASVRLRTHRCVMIENNRNVRNTGRERR